MAIDRLAPDSAAILLAFTIENYGIESHPSTFQRKGVGRERSEIPTHSNFAFYYPPRRVLEAPICATFLRYGRRGEGCEIRFRGGGRGVEFPSDTTTVDDGFVNYKD